MRSLFSRRFSAVWVVGLVLVGCILASAAHALGWGWVLIPLLIFGFGIWDLTQSRHSILRNYPIFGHARYLLESIRPEIRQYFIENDTDEKPFSRSQRTLVYQRAKNTVDSQPFGTLLDVKAAGYEWVGHSLQPTVLPNHDFRVIVGEGRAQPHSMSVFNVSGMSFGALSANAIKSLNLGAKLGNFSHDTGEGSISPHHREHGGDLTWQIASGYFGCRTPEGRFDPESFARQAKEPQIKMIEIKLSQGAKPGHGGVLPAAKITPEIALTRGISMGQDCVSPSSHSEFSTPIELLEFVERLRTLSGGKPTGFKLCVGHPWEFFSIAKAMLQTGILPDFIVVDGSEGGTGAAPVEFTDHVGVPLQEGLLLVHNTLVGAGLRERIKIGASGKIISAFDIARAMAMGADWCNSARGFMFALGCIQAQKCHTDRCPAGVATQDPVRQRAIVVPTKGERVRSFHANTLHALQELIQAAGLHHPNQLRARHIMRRVSSSEVRLLSEHLNYLEPDDLLNGTYRYDLYAKYWPEARAESFNLPAGSIGSKVQTAQ